VLDVIVIGAGAAGMMCAAQAGQTARRVLLIEHYHKLGEKIRISGAGAATSQSARKPENFLSNNPHFCRSALARLHAAAFCRLGRTPSHQSITRRRSANCSATAHRSRSSIF